MIRLQNKNWKIQIAELGAELQSCKDTADGTEYIWCGNPDIWKEHAPLLFPIVGRHKDDLCDYGDGKEYPLRIHGFAKRQTFTVNEADDTHVSLTLVDNEETRVGYPFAFSLTSEFSLSGDVLTVVRRVKNRDDKPMPYMIGEHFGFTVPYTDAQAYEDFYIRFDETEDSDCWPLNENHYVDKSVPYLKHTDVMPLDRRMFDRDAVIFTDIKSRAVTLCSDKTTKGVRVEYPGFPFIGFWAKPAAPYLCIEPWTGHDSAQSDSRKVLEKENVTVLAPGEEKETVCRIIFRR